MATSKIKNIEEKTFQGKVTGHTVTLEDGVSGYLDDKGSDKVAVGDNVDYSLVVKKNKAGKDYNLLTLKRALAQQTTDSTPPKTNNGASTAIPPLVSRDVAKLKYEVLVPVAQIVMEGVKAGKVKDNLETFREWYNGIVSDIYGDIDDLTKLW